jgi:hypothetical protein
LWGGREPKAQFTEALMSPAELKNLNIEHFQRVLDRTTDPDERTKIKAFINEERAKPDSAYPSDSAGSASGAARPGASV